MPRKRKTPPADSSPGPKRSRARAPVNEGQPRPPRGLSPAARRVWRQLATELDSVLAPADALALGLAAEAATFALDAARIVHSEGYEVEDPAHAGAVRKSPTWLVFTQASSLFLSYANVLGLTPKAREGLTAKEPDGSAGAAFMEFLNRRASVATTTGPQEAEEW